eukprot:Selendium_serpulae@DN3351_c1_g1_i1.p1
MARPTVDLYFQYYGKLSNQYNMLQDTVRTNVYHRAILFNRSEFQGRTVMDVGAGSGILSFFCAQAGAAKVYSVEASSMSQVIDDLVVGNPFWGRALKVVHKTVETIRLKSGDDDKPTSTTSNDFHSSSTSSSTPLTNDEAEFDLDSKVDVLVSEPIGTFLFNERMIESYLFARDKFLKPGGKMYPNRSRLYLAPFSDSVLFTDVSTRGQFWKTTSFYGLSLEAAAPRASEEQFRQPVVDYLNPAILLAEAHCEDFDFTTIPRSALEKMEFSFDFPITSPALVHGLAGWFDVYFDGAEKPIAFSTAPTEAPTHWYQIRFLFKTPLAVNPNQRLVGSMTLDANDHQSYYINIVATIAGTDISTHSATLDLKDPDYRYYSSPGGTYYPQAPAADQMGVDLSSAPRLVDDVGNPIIVHSSETAINGVAGEGQSEGWNGP